MLDLTALYNAKEADRLKIRALLEIKDVSRLKTALELLSSEQLMSPQVLRDTLPAFEAVGMKDEAALARDTLTKSMYQDVLTVWFDLDGDKLRSVAGTMASLGSTQGVPAGLPLLWKGISPGKNPL